MLPSFSARPFRLTSRSAISLIETLVVIGIIGVLIALLLPAVQAVRESSNRVRCRNNLRQFGLAIHQLDQEKGELPPVWGSLPRRGDPWRTQISFGSVFFQLLPYVEQGNLYQSSFRQDKTFPGGNFDESAVRQQPVAVFVCPSDPTNDKPGLGSYAANERVFLRFPPAGKLNGNDSLSKCIPDGLSNTVLFTELLGQCGNGRGGSVDIYWSDQWANCTPEHLFERRTSPLTGGVMNAATPHQTMPICLADGSVRDLDLSLPISIWYAILLPDDGRGLTGF